LVKPAIILARCSLSALYQVMILIEALVPLFVRALSTKDRLDDMTHPNLAQLFFHIIWA